MGGDPRNSATGRVDHARPVADNRLVNPLSEAGTAWLSRCMNPELSRRRFLSRSTVALGGLAAVPVSLQAVDPPKRSAASRLLLSLAAYSFRDFLKDSNHKRENETD